MHRSLHRSVSFTLLLLGTLLGCKPETPYHEPDVTREHAQITHRDHLGPMAWDSSQWQARVRGVRTSYNETSDLSDEELTLTPGDERWLDFVYWTLNNKIAEHQVEQYGGTDWDGPQGGVIFHWAPGSHWECDTLASFGFAIGHVIGEHRWMDTMFPDFFEKHGGVKGVNVKDRLYEIDPASPGPWVEFLEHIGSSNSPYYRYLFHQEAVVDPVSESIHLIGGQGVAFTYSFRRYYHELREVLTDARAVDFFQMYDRFGRGFASTGNWAGQGATLTSLSEVAYARPEDRASAGSRYDPNPPAVEVPAGLPEAEAMRRGKDIYLAQCAVCHGIEGDGQGFLGEGFQVKPRDFTRGTYKFRSTHNGEFPSITDIERTIRVGVPGTTMPGWSQFLSEDQVRDVARYLIVFSESLQDSWKEQEVPVAIEIPPVPENLETLVEQGRREYVAKQCAPCHGATGVGDGATSQDLRDSWGHPHQSHRPEPQVVLPQRPHSRGSLPFLGRRFERFSDAGDRPRRAEYRTGVGVDCIHSLALSRGASLSPARELREGAQNEDREGRACAHGGGVAMNASRWRLAWAIVFLACAWMILAWAFPCQIDSSERVVEPELKRVGGMRNACRCTSRIEP